MVWCSVLSNQFREYLKRKKWFGVWVEDGIKERDVSHLIRTMGSLHIGPVSLLESVTEEAWPWKPGWDLRCMLMGCVRPALGILIPPVSRGLREMAAGEEGVAAFTQPQQDFLFPGGREVNHLWGVLGVSWVPYHWNKPFNLPQPPNSANWDQFHLTPLSTIRLF